MANSPIIAPKLFTMPCWLANSTGSSISVRCNRMPALAPIIGARAGIRLQREEIDDAVLFANQHGIVNNFAAMVGQFAMEAWDPDYIPNKYMKDQLLVCNRLEIKPTNCIIFALSNKEEHKQFNRGNALTRLCISKLIVEEHDRRT